PTPRVAGATAGSGRPSVPEGERDRGESRTTVGPCAASSRTLARAVPLRTGAPGPSVRGDGGGRRALAAEVTSNLTTHRRWVLDRFQVHPRSTAPRLGTVICSGTVGGLASEVGIRRARALRKRAEPTVATSSTGNVTVACAKWGP